VYIIAMYSSECTCYGVATVSRLLKIIGLFCNRALQKRRYSAKETYDFKEPTNRSHPIVLCASPSLLIIRYSSVGTVFFVSIHIHRDTVLCDVTQCILS